MKIRLALAVLLFAAAPVQADGNWDKIYAVLSHPRCSNCHVSDEHPRWFDAVARTARFHAMNVKRGSDGFGNPGLRCTACHGPANSPVSGGPPGAPGWHLAPAEMVWFGKSSAEVCAQFKDPARNGGRTIEALANHVREDKLVVWGWQPGGNREPAPGSAQALYDAIIAWGAAGSPCP